MVAIFTEWILSRGGWLAVGLVFLLPALESSAFLGFLFPGEIAVVLGGVLAYNGRAALPEVMVAAVSGAILGDTIGYYVGKRWGERLLSSVGRRIPFIRHRIDDHLQSAKAYLRRRGGTAVFLGRFTAALRVMVPGLAGMAEMPYPEFLFFNAVGGLIWGVAFVSLGYFAGAAWERVAADASRVGIALVILIISGLVATRLLRNVRERGELVSDRLGRIRPVAWVRRTFPGPSGWLARRTDTASPTGFWLSVAVLAAGACAWLFAGVTQDVVAHEEAARSDLGIERFFAVHHTSWITTMLKDATWLGSNDVLIPLVVGIAIYLLARGRERLLAVLLVAAIAGANTLYDIVKPLVGRPRPPVSVHLIGASGFAFPSGHATAAVAVWGAAALVLSASRSNLQKLAIWGCALLIAAVVAFSCVYLGVHWWTDVVAGMALGGFWLCILALVMLVARSKAVASDADLVAPNAGP